MALSMLADLLMAGFAAFAALYLRLGGDWLNRDASASLLLIFIWVVIAAAVFGWLGLHRGTWRYASLSELWLIIKSATAAVLLLAVIKLVPAAGSGADLSVLAILWLLLIVGLGGMRLAYRQMQDWRDTGVDAVGRSPGPARPVLLFGTGGDAELFIRAARSEPRSGYRVVGMVDDSDRLVGRSVHGVEILGSVGNLPAIIRSLEQKGSRPTEIIFAQSASAMPTTAKRNLFTLAQSSGLSVSRLPRVGEIATAGLRRGVQVEPITLEDLLGRPQHALDQAAITRLISGRSVLVTGAGGSIGSELVRQIAALEPARLVLADHCEFNLYQIDLELAEGWPRLMRTALICDVRDRNSINRLFEDHRPDIVFHAAALKHVPLVERNPVEGVLTNVQGTVNVADACHAHRATAMVMISTDKAVNPTSVMGATKRLAECYCQALDVAAGAPLAHTRFVGVRFGNILGSSGSVVPLFQRQIAQGGPVTVTDPEMTRYFMTDREATSLILQAFAHALNDNIDRGHILILDMGEPVKILDVARQLIQLAGLAPEVDIRIELVGPRPGEKLSEDLFYPSEVPVSTHVEGVLAARSQPVPLHVLRPVIDDLVHAAWRGDSGAALRSRLIDALQRFDDRGPPEAERVTPAEPRGDHAKTRCRHGESFLA
jgi:O-antigen biosynthesis protein WbqV